MADTQQNITFGVDDALLTILLADRTLSSPDKQVNIFWATDNYADRGAGYRFDDKIAVEAVSGDNARLVIPRAFKPEQTQRERVRKMAEVFTPSWICNEMINCVDEIWFERKDVFNVMFTDNIKCHRWEATEGKIEIPPGKTWQQYVMDNRLEITCGEAPFLVSRYEPVDGVVIPVPKRIGVLDRKLRIVHENTLTPDEWAYWAKAALKSTYGYEWQGDSLLLARKNLLLSYIDYYQYKFGDTPSVNDLKDAAYIISWNIWQMDGLKYVIPKSCHDIETVTNDLFEQTVERKPCPGCKHDDVYRHTGVYCKIMDWEEGHPIDFISLRKKEGAK